MTAALTLLGVLAALSILLSDAPRIVAWPGAVIAMGWGAWLARSETRKPVLDIVIRPAERGAMPVATVDGRTCQVLRLRWRGPVAFLDLEDADCTRRIVLGPEVLTAPVRRELRLIVPRGAAASARPSVAP